MLAGCANVDVARMLLHFFQWQALTAGVWLSRGQPNFTQEEADRLVRDIQFIYNITDEERCARHITDMKHSRSV